jgi:hypothetical protein
VVIPNDNPILSGEDAEEVIREIDRIMADCGYQQVRMDRWRHPEVMGSWVERGYVYGEVTVRFSRRENFRIMRPHQVNSLRRLVTENEEAAA